MLKIGDKVKVMKLDPVDKEDTNLKVGDIGTIQTMEQDDDDEYDDSYTCEVKFGGDFVNRENHNNGADGAYVMFMYQLEPIEETEVPE